MSDFKPGDRVKVHTPGTAWHGRTGTVEEDDPQLPAAEEGYDYWVRLDGTGLFANGPFAFDDEELRLLEDQDA